jgi:ATP-dependent Clp protease protease subunit
LRDQLNAPFRSRIPPLSLLDSGHQSTEGVGPVHVTTPTSAHTPFLQAGNGHASLHDAVYDRLLRERIVFLGSQVDDDIANQICAQMLLLSADDPHRDFHLYINSPGG